MRSVQNGVPHSWAYARLPIPELGPPIQTSQVCFEFFVLDCEFSVLDWISDGRMFSIGEYGFKYLENMLALN